MRKPDRDRERLGRWCLCCLLASAMGGAWADDAPVAVATSAVPTAAEAKLPPEDASAIVDGLAAHVNGDAITIADVMVGVRMFLRDPAWEAGRGREEAFRDAYAEALGELVNQRLILQEYRAGQVRLPAWVIEKRLAELLDTRFDGDRGRLLKELADQRLTVEDWRTRVEEQMIVAAMRQSQVDAHIQIGPSQILAHYQAHVTNYVQKAATQVGLILLKPRGDEGEEALAARAAAVLQRLKSGEKFEAVARDVSDDSSREDGGQWGWIVPEEVLRDELAQALAALPVQQHKAVAMSTGTYILHKMAERKAGQRTIEEARPEIERELFKAESQRLFLAWMMRLRAKAHIQTFDILK